MTKKAKSTKSDDENEPVWGAEKIGVEIGLKERQAFWLLENGRLPAKKVGGRWVSTKGALRRAISVEA